MQTDAVALDYAKAYVASRKETSIRCDAITLDLYTDNYSDLVEAVIVIANNQYLLKAEANPYMMKDRPIVTYVPEKVPGRLVATQRSRERSAIHKQDRINPPVRHHDFDVHANRCRPAADDL